MSLNYTALVAQGRAKAMGIPWSNEELAALLTLETERGVGRQLAADFVRNGILTLEAYDEAIKAKFKPMTMDEASAEVGNTMKAKGAVFSAKKGKGKK